MGQLRAGWIAVAGVIPTWALDELESFRHEMGLPNPSQTVGKVLTEWALERRRLALSRDRQEAHPEPGQGSSKLKAQVREAYLP